MLGTPGLLRFESQLLSYRLPVNVRKAGKIKAYQYGKRTLRFDPDEVRAIVREGQGGSLPPMENTNDSSIQRVPLGFPESLQEEIADLPLEQKVALKRWIEREYL